ncbi:unnamed protein product, partial [Dicrocoelium dendriticum]
HCRRLPDSDASPTAMLTFNATLSQFSAHAPPNACVFTAATYRTPTHRQPPCSQNFPLTPGCVLSAVSPWVPPSTGESSCHLAR